MQLRDAASKATYLIKPRNLKKLAVVVVVLFGVFSAGWVAGGSQLPFLRQTNRPGQSNLPADLDYASVEEVYDALRSKYDGELTYQQILDDLKQGIARSTGDPYTEYLNYEQSQEFDEELSGTFSGIGAELSKDTTTNNVIIVAPIAGYPAQKAGLQPKDAIVEIDGESAYDLTITEAVKRIRGPKGTKVTLKIIRDSKQELNFEIIREDIVIPSVEQKILEGNIGYLQIVRFGTDTAKLAQDAASAFKRAGVKGIIVDVRNNPGGLLDAAVEVSGLWLQNKTVLEEKRSGVLVRRYTSDGNATLAGVPTIVLINEGSASASEIVAGALRDNDAAHLIGMKTFGKGSVQEITPLRDGGSIKVTIARWYTPAGKNIDKEGIEPDQKVDRTDDDYVNNRDPQLDAAVASLGQ